MTSADSNSIPTVLITGANRGLGLGLARAFHEAGWRIIAVGRSDSAELDLLAGDRLEFHPCNLTGDSDLAALKSVLGDRIIDVLINNAGKMITSSFVKDGGSVQGFGHFKRDQWRELFDINLFTPMYLSELLADNIAQAKNGRIVTISSMLGSMEMNDMGGIYAYRASKAGVNAIMKSMSVDLKERGITAIAMHPGWVQTDMGGSGADIDVETSVSGMKRVIDDLSLADSGKFISYNGQEMPW